MDASNNEQTELLRNIWNEIKALGTNLGARIDKTNDRIDETNARLDQTNARLEQTNARIGQTNDRLGQTNERLDGVVVEVATMSRRFTEMDVRLSTSVAELAADVRTLTTGIANRRADDKRLRKCESEIVTLQERLQALETKRT